MHYNRRKSQQLLWLSFKTSGFVIVILSCTAKTSLLDKISQKGIWQCYSIWDYILHQWCERFPLLLQFHVWNSKSLAYQSWPGEEYLCFNHKSARVSEFFILYILHLISFMYEMNDSVWYACIMVKVKRSLISNQLALNKW